MKKSLGLHYLIARFEFWCLLFGVHSRNLTSSNQRLGSAFYTLCSVFMENCSRPRGLKSMYAKTRPLEKNWRGGQFAVFTKEVSISRACGTKLGCVLSFLEDAILKNLFLWDRTCTSGFWGPFLESFENFSGPKSHS